MALSRSAREFAAEILQHDWSDAPYRGDRAGHNRETDTKRSEKVLTPEQTECVRSNVMWVTAQVLWHRDPNFDLYEFAEACGVAVRNKDGSQDGGIRAGLRIDNQGRRAKPGTWDYGPE